MQHADPMRSDAAHCPMQPSDPIQAATAALTEAIVAPGAMERTAKMAEAKMIFMIVDCLLVGVGFDVTTIALQKLWQLCEDETRGFKDSTPLP